MKKFLIAMGVAAFTFVGCDDSSSASAGPNDEPAVESSSVAEHSSSSSSAQKNSSSSEKAKSSSSVSQSDAKQSSSSEKTGKSSGSVDDASSSSVKSESSSSDENSQSSSSSSTNVRSSSSETESSSSSVSELSSSSLNDFDWSLPKEAYLNPEIKYDSVTDTRDGKVYRTVKIGEQTWMAENLNFDPGQGGSGEDKYDWSWCYNDEPANCDVTGRFYTWAAAIDSVKLANDADNPLECGYDKFCNLTGTVQGICPTGWHLPSRTEWDVLFTAVGGQSSAGKVLKSQTGWHKNKGTDAFGFAVLPTGLGAPKDTFDYVGWLAYFWSSTESDRSRACSVSMDYYYADAGLGNITKYFGYSVRCVKD